MKKIYRLLIFSSISIGISILYFLALAPLNTPLRFVAAVIGGFVIGRYGTLLMEGAFQWYKKL